MNKRSSSAWLFFKACCGAGEAGKQRLFLCKMSEIKFWSHVSESKLSISFELRYPASQGTYVGEEQDCASGSATM